MTERSWGAHHPVVDFDYDGIDGKPPADLRSIEQFTEAMTNLLQWIICNGSRKATPHGIYVRVMVLLFLISPHSIGITTQKDLAARIGCSRSWINEVVRDFVERYGFIAQHLKLTYHPRQKRPKRRGK